MMDNDNIDTFSWYEKTKERYIHEIMLLANKQPQPPKIFPYTEELKEKLISYIKSKGGISKKYEVIKNNNKELIILKKKARDDPLVEVLPATECFDIMAEIHLQHNHAKATEMAAILKNVCYVFFHVINIFIRACYVCAEKTIVEKADNVPRVPNHPKYIPEHSVQCNITPVYTQDKGHSHVIVYMDNLNNYTLVRPTYSASHVVFAYELLKIFLDFGLPENITFRWGDEYTNVLKKVLESTDIFSHMPNLYNKKHAGRIEWISRNPCGPIQSWIIEHGTNWASTISVLQWQLNNLGDVTKLKSRKLVKSQIKSPYHAYFGVLPFENVIEITEKSEQTEKKFLMDAKINNKTTNFNGYCNNCGKDLNEIYRSCASCKKKCHFNCCILNMHLLAYNDRRLEATCMPCVAAHSGESNRVRVPSGAHVSNEYLSQCLKI